MLSWTIFMISWTRQTVQSANLSTHTHIWKKCRFLDFFYNLICFASPFYWSSRNVISGIYSQSRVSPTTGRHLCQAKSLPALNSPYNPGPHGCCRTTLSRATDIRTPSSSSLHLWSLSAAGANPFWSPCCWGKRRGWGVTPSPSTLECCDWNLDLFVFPSVYGLWKYKNPRKCSQNLLWAQGKTQMWEGQSRAWGNALVKGSKVVSYSNTCRSQQFVDPLHGSFLVSCHTAVHIFSYY